MKIKHIDVVDFAPFYSGGGYVMSTGRDIQLHNRLIRLHTDDGAFGIGEIAHPPVYDPAVLAAMEDTLVPELDGIELGDLPALLTKWRGGEKALQGFVFGVELAMLDLMGRILGVPVSALLGGAVSRDVPEYLSLSCESPGDMAETVRRKGQGFVTIQAKLGDGSLELDLNRVRSVLSVMRADQQLLADFNGALAAEDAIRALPDLTDARVIWEEPCAEYDDNVRVARAISAPVMFDQCLKDLNTYARALKDGAAAAMVIKSDSIGGLSVGRTVRDMCSAAGIKTRIDGWWSGQLAGAGALHLAMGTANDGLIASIDLTDPLDTGREMIVKPAHGRVAPAAGPGLGMLPASALALFD
jgi:L-alanine-DL-glutamate epimerase-like enolase superfamily enzyme